ncbi:DUF5063 domain-containing protein [Bacillus sp. EB600]|uniref:DUF5063 domain-containing protein n=1 Tax=Bacillus sp. EB600 TaxID=2806345 RepID=UPI002109BA3F|nr:DUF5063 domain-containing protein [Bacillus sp. EB600]MCQ6282332.1 DUF5063 domain-containing protein [Bacillus sp. EB600]
MKNAEVELFYLSALQYCSIIENFNFNNENNKLKNLLISLLSLYSKALYLPKVEPKNDEVPDFEISIPQISFGKYNQYWEVFNPYYLEKPVVASLLDDTLDIYIDVKRGIILYENKEYLESIWEWKCNFEIHWGSHAVDAIRALHSVIFDDPY